MYVKSNFKNYQVCDKEAGKYNPKEKINQQKQTQQWQMITLVYKDIKKIIINLFHMFMKIEESMSMLMRHGK